MLPLTTGDGVSAMSAITNNATSERIAGREGTPAVNVPTSRRLIDGRTAAAKAGCSYRTWLRLCDAGKAPAGLKLSALRRWDEQAIDLWIAHGCPPVRVVKGGRR